jgi:hypothetical protein
MMNIEKVLKNDRLMHALTGMSAKEFEDLLPEFKKAWEVARMRKYRNDPNRERRPGGGKKGFLKTSREKLFFILLYYKCYPTYDVASFLYACDRSAACRRQQKLSMILELTLKQKLVLPKRQIRSIEDFLNAFPEAKEVFIDGTERPIQRPKDKETQKANYSGKKKRHTRKNIIISTKEKRIGFLSKTVEGKESDITVLRATAPPRFIPPKVKTHVDLGFKGLDTEYPDHCISIPAKKPRTRDLTEAQKAKNKKKSGVRVLVEHAIGGIKRFGIVSQVFRNKKAGFDDTAMLISSGLWNYHLAMS